MQSSPICVRGTRAAQSTERWGGDYATGSTANYSRSAAHVKSGIGKRACSSKHATSLTVGTAAVPKDGGICNVAGRIIY
jgi:hypothetical protein